MNELHDFLSFLHGDRAASTRPLQFASEAKQEFYRFLEREGVEYCNFGTFQIEDEERIADPIIGANTDPRWMDEYFGERLDRYDYVLKRANALDPARPIDRFLQDGMLAAAMADEHPEAAHTIRRAADFGFEIAHVIIGRTSVAAAPGKERFYGFLFGGKADSKAQIAAELDKLEIAAMALIDKLQPELYVMADGADVALTARELDCLGCASEGLQRAEIAHRLGISLPTVDLHLANMRKRLNVRTMAEAVAKGYRYGLI